MHTEQNKTNNLDYEVVHTRDPNGFEADGIITFRNPNTTLGYIRYLDTGDIEYIFVHPQYRRKGIATKLVDMVETHTGKKANPETPILPLGQKFFDAYFTRRHTA